MTHLPTKDRLQYRYSSILYILKTEGVKLGSLVYKGCVIVQSAVPSLRWVKQAAPQLGQCRHLGYTIQYIYISEEYHHFPISFCENVNFRPKIDLKSIE